MFFYRKISFYLVELALRFKQLALNPHDNSPEPL